MFSDCLVSVGPVLPGTGPFQSPCLKNNFCHCFLHEVHFTYLPSFPASAAVSDGLDQSGTLHRRRPRGLCLISKKHFTLQLQFTKVTLCPLQTPASGQPAVREDDRTGSIYIHGKGTVMTYMFEVRPGTASCRLPPVLRFIAVLVSSRSGRTPAGSGTLSRASGCCCRCSGRSTWTSSRPGSNESR